VVITVSDTGLGIPADMHELIFEMFTQVRDMEGGHQGLGIGLTLVKRLVEMHGGTVTVESEGRNQGSRFYVRLPTMVQSAPRPAFGSGGALRPASVKRRVLVVDDNADALSTLSMLVKIMGHDVFEARDGAEAVRLAEQHRPDVVLMDIGMPNLNGYDAAKQIRAESWGRDMVLVATTGWGQDEDRQRTRAAGFDQHLVKPVDHAALQAILEAAPPTSDETAVEAAETVVDVAAVSSNRVAQGVRPKEMPGSVSR
jgi:CheY-like chemotaxis protein